MKKHKLDHGNYPESKLYGRYYHNILIIAYTLIKVFFMICLPFSVDLIIGLLEGAPEIIFRSENKNIRI